MTYVEAFITCKNMQKHLSNEKITVYVSIENAIKMQF